MLNQQVRRERIRSQGFTLVELLVVLFIMLMLATIALPTVKRLLSDQKASRAARNAAIFFDSARNRAIAENRYVGVRIERLGANPYGQAAAIRLRQLVGIPPYTGDSTDAMATLQGTTSITSATFQANDCPLLSLSSRLLNNEIGAGVPDTSDDHLAPIRVGDLLELPGGRSVPITGITDNFAGGGPPTMVTVTFNLNEPVNGNNTFPGTVRDTRIATGESVFSRFCRWRYCR